MSDSAPTMAQPEASIDASVILRALLGKLVRIGFVTILLLAVAYAILLFVPRLYESRAELLVEPRSTVFTSAASNQNAESYFIDAAAVSSQIELIKSRDTILATIEAIDLRQEPAFEGWSDEDIIGEISDNLIVTQERSSRLISVAYRATDPELAARIANGLARIHVQRRAGQQIADTIEATGWLEDEINRLRQNVAEAERAIADFRVENDLFTGSNNESLTNQQLSNFATQIAAAAERRSAAQSRAQLIRSLLESGQPVVGVSDVQASAVVQQLSQELARLQGERAQQSATLLPNHPTIRALDAQIAAINEQISNEGQRVAQALEAQAQIEADLEQSLQAELDRIKVTAGSDTVEGVTLAELEREAAAERDLLNAYLLRFTEATARSDIGSSLPDVRFVSEAAPSSSPASPQTTLILMAVGIASILLQVGGVIFSELLSGRALVEHGPSSEPPLEKGSDNGLIAANSDSSSEPLAITGIHAPLGALETEIQAQAARALAGLDRLIVIASDNGWDESMNFAERLTAAIVGNGQSVAEIDAASGQQGIELGLTDLCAGDADFGEVVHRGIEERFGFVPWGQGERLSPNPDRILTLIDALADIYEVVIVVTGGVGMGSNLPLFADAGAKCLLLAHDETGETRREVAMLGFDELRVIPTHERQSEVA
ncbi:GumC family protein [Pelagibacterium sp. H642]|uniref:GumC family protein n=1 Tax=Pelagibacterium sp. H642 TaxID=1881069 RepID=UPI002815145F|nr:GumC family protein [Pelagibacterium sp. H642]WMT90754.1 GumC family protein [Pelagibacterium sp. H642]